MSIERYDPIRVLGEGSFGKVYLMRDKVKRNFVCVKIIKIKNIPKKEREATKVEVDLLRRLHHPNIVRYIDSFLSRNNESLCICMEYCDGGDLASQIKAARRNLFSESKILHWFVQLTLGLHYMHTNKVLHRDLKTQNVFMLGNGRLVLGDLGISKVLDGTMDFAQTCIGTPYYMSPEIFKNKPYSYKSDVWALGCVLYEMTTLNHAFDANSLNGLATKIVKGKYPPINAKYSKFLRELIAQMLQINPQARPDLDQILRKPFIKKHIVNFFTDIASRPSNSLGEGTMIFKAAAGGPVSNNALGSDTNMISLRQQLHALDMTDAIGDALKPKSNPQDDEEAIRLAKESASALKREQEHKKMVEAALEKLRLERESRKNAEPSGRPMGYAQGRQPSQAAINAAKRVEEASRLAGYRQQPSVAVPQRPSNGNLAGMNNGPSSEAARKESAAVRDRGMNWNKRPEEKGAPAGRQAANDSDNVSVGGGNGPRRRQSFGEDRDRIVERERKAAEERRKLQQDQEAARVRAEDRRREEVKAEARAREEARLREEARQKEEVSARSNLEKVRAQAEAAAKAKREQLREKERQRQKEEFDQLKRDKLELDRRTNERDRVREERRAQERSRLEGGRDRRDMDVLQEKLSHMNEQIQQIPKFEPRNRAEEKEDNLSARDRVALRRQEKAQREEAERIEALAEAERENRRIRQQAQQQHRSNWHAQQESPQDHYEFDSAGRKPKGRMDADELTDRLNEASKGRNRFESNDVPNTGRSSIGGRGSVAAAENDYNSDTASEEGSLWGERGNLEEEEEDLHRREEELQAELNFATLRVNELKRTLQETKSYLGPRMPTRGKDAAPSGAGRQQWAEEEVEDEDEFYDSDEQDFEQPSDFVEEAVSSKGRSHNPSEPRIDETVRRLRPAVLQVEAQSHSYGLSDPPSPSGRLDDRIYRLRQRCVDALGKEAFGEVYWFLKQHEEESQGYDNGRDMNEDDFEARKVAKVRSILGEQRAQYMSLIEQLIFMEETHSG